MVDQMLIEHRQFPFPRQNLCEHLKFRRLLWIDSPYCFNIRLHDPSEPSRRQSLEASFLRLRCRRLPHLRPHLLHHLPHRRDVTRIAPFLPSFITLRRLFEV